MIASQAAPPRNQPADTAPRLVALPPAQRRVLGELTRDGAGNRTIASRLGLNENTFRSHVKDVLRVCGDPTRTALVVACLRRHVVVRVSERRPL